MSNHTFKTALAAHIEARNFINKKHNDFHPLAMAAMAPFVGQKICKADGSLLAKVEKCLADFVPLVLTEGWQAYYSTGHGYNLTLNLKAWRQVQKAGEKYSVSCYEETALYIAHLQNGILTSLYSDLDKRRTDFTEAEIAKARLEVDKRKEQLREAQSKLAQFGEYDS